MLSNSVSALPKIFIVTPSFNSIRTICETIKSMRSQSYPNIERIVMDVRFAGRHGGAAQGIS